MYKQSINKKNSQNSSPP